MSRYPMDMEMRRGRREERDYARRRRNSRGQFTRDYRMEEDGHHYPREEREYYGTYGDTPFYMRGGEMYDFASRRDYDDYGRGRDYARRRDYARGRRDYGYGRDYNYDYGRDYGEDEKLDREEIDEWIEKLLKELSTDEKEMLKMDKVVKRATDLGIKFDKFDEREFYVTTLMVFTDYKQTLGKSNIDLYVRIGKDWLEDPDAEVRYGSKLAAYYDSIVCPED